MEKIFLNIKFGDYVKKWLYFKYNKINIKFSLMKLLIILLLIQNLNSRFIYKFFSSNKIGTHLNKKKSIRELNLNNTSKEDGINYNSNKFINIALLSIDNINSQKTSGKCLCEIINIFPDKQFLHKIVNCFCEELICSLSDFSDDECYLDYKMDNCGCEIVDVLEENIKIDCKCNRKIFDCSGVNFFNKNCRPNIIDEIEKYEDAEYIFQILDEIEEGNFTDIFTRAIEENETFIEYENNITYK